MQAEPYVPFFAGTVPFLSCRKIVEFVPFYRFADGEKKHDIFNRFFIAYVMLILRQNPYINCELFNVLNGQNFSVGEMLFFTVIIFMVKYLYVIVHTNVHHIFVPKYEQSSFNNN